MSGLSGIDAKIPALFPDLPAACAGIGVGMVHAGLNLLENLSQNICCGTNLVLGLVDPNSSGGVAYPYAWRVLSIQLTPGGCSVSPVVPEADKVDQLQVLSMEKQV